MPLRLWRRVRIAPGVTLNISKRGISASFGRRGAKVTLGHGRVRRTLGLPGTGLFYTTTSKIADGSTPTSSDAAVADDEAPTGEPTAQRRRGRSRIGCLGSTFGLLLILAFIGTLAGSPGAGPSATPFPGIGGNTTSTDSAPGIVSLPTFGLPAPTAGETAAPAPTSAPTPRPTSLPKPTPKPVALTVRITKPPGVVYRNSYATLSARTHAGARCSIVVEYASGPSTASGLGPKTASSSGSVSWTWKIGGSTTTGTWPIYVTCTWSGQQAEAVSQVTVR